MDGDLNHAYYHVLCRANPRLAKELDKTENLPMNPLTSEFDFKSFLSFIAENWDEPESEPIPDPPSKAEIRKRILDTAEDEMSDFLYYNRKEDEELPVGAIEEAIQKGIITVEEILEVFRKHLK